MGFLGLKAFFVRNTMEIIRIVAMTSIVGVLENHFIFSSDLIMVTSFFCGIMKARVATNQLFFLLESSFGEEEAV